MKSIHSKENMYACELFSSVIIFALCSTSVRSQTFGNVKSLINDLFTGYQKDIIPVQDQSEPLKIKTLVWLVSMSNFDEVAGTISVVVVVELWWQDTNLKWNPSDYGNKSHLVIPKSRIWSLDLYLVNTADKIHSLSSDNDFKVVLFASGDVSSITGDGITASCEPDMTKFPFDTQTCDMIFIPWGYFESSVQLELTQAEAMLRRYTENGEWSLIEASCKIFNYSSASELYFTTTIKRKPTYFIITIILPVISLSVVNPLVFFLPAESGERVSFSITISLAFAVFLSMTSTTIPQSSNPMARLTYFIFGSQMLSGCIVVLNSFIIVVYSQSSDKKVSKLFCFVVKMHQKLVSCFVIRKKVLIHPRLTTAATQDKLDMRNIAEGDDKCDEQDIKSTLANKNDSITWEMVGKTLDKLAFVVTKLIVVIAIILFIINVVL